MPLQTQPENSDAYVRHTRIYFSNEDQVGTPGVSTFFNYSIALNDEIQNVIGCELTGFSMAKQLTPTFRGRYIIGSTLPYANTTNTRRTTPLGNCIFDVRMTDTNNVETITFTVDLEVIVPTLPAVPYSLAGRVMSMDDIGDQVTAGVLSAMDTVGSGVINSTLITLVGSIDANGCYVCYAFEIAAPSNKIQIEFLFGTGTNITETPHRVLGFPALTDTVPDSVTNGVQGINAVDPNPVRYVDIHINQFREFKPFARVFLPTNTNFSWPINRPTDFRLLTEPMKNLTKLDIRLEFNDRQSYSADADVYHEIGLDVISLESIGKKPNWVEQQFLI